MPPTLGLQPRAHAFEGLYQSPMGLLAQEHLAASLPSRYSDLPNAHMLQKGVYPSGTSDAMQDQQFRTQSHLHERADQFQGGQDDGGTAYHNPSSHFFGQSTLGRSAVNVLRAGTNANGYEQVGGNLGPDSVLFQKAVPVNISTSQGRSEVPHPITITIHTPSPRGQSPTLSLQFTDESDPFFLYYLNLPEHDFPKVKNEQHLLVDFQMFPCKIVELLECCMRDAGNGKPRFVAQLQQNDAKAVLSIIESNTFKNISHLTLELTAANDTVLKTHLAGMVKDLKSQCSEVISSLNTTRNHLNTCTQQNNDLATQMDHLKHTHANELKHLEADHREYLRQIKEEEKQEKDRVRLEAEAWKRDVEKSYEEKLKSLSIAHQNLNTSHTHLLSRNRTLESTLTTTRTDLENLRRDNRNNLSSLASKDEIISELKERNRTVEALLEDERMKLKMSDERVTKLEAKGERLEDEVREIGQEKGQVEEALTSAKEHSLRLEDTIRKCREEIFKGNDIIQRLQSSLRTTKTALKLKSQMNVQQASLLSERTESLHAVQEKYRDLESDLKKLDQTKSDLERKAKEEASLREKCEKQVQENEKVIEWLHEQLNQAPKPTVRPPFSRSNRIRANFSSAVGPGLENTLTSGIPATDKAALGTTSRGHSYKLATSTATPENVACESENIAHDLKSTPNPNSATSMPVKRSAYFPA